MKNTASKRLGSITVLSLLALLAIVIGAQAAFAGSSSTAAAGTHGRGGVSVAGVAALATTPAGTQGRGGVAAVSVSATPARAAASGGSRLPIRARGGYPRPGSGSLPASLSVTTTSNVGVRLAVGLAGAVLLVSIAVWVSYRRRGARAESSLAAFCSLHPDDAACMAA